MAEPRDRQIAVNIEDTFWQVVQIAATKNNESTSTYVRNLIIKDLLQRGLLSERVLAQVVMG